MALPCTGRPRTAAPMSEPTPKPQTEKDEARLFREGIDLFNCGEWFEAHEVWEDIWHMASGRKKRFYQGLIQCAVTIEHMRRGNPRGVRSVWRSCQGKFEDVPSLYMGVDVAHLLAEIRRVVQPVLDLPAERFAPDYPRPQQLPVDWLNMPRIDLVYDPFAEDDEPTHG